MKTIISIMVLILFISSNVMASSYWDSEEAHYSTRALAQDTNPKVSMADKIRAYAQDCFDKELSLWERRGRLPTQDEADLILDACVNPRF